ncbi:hypothetical protein DER45DRAFT_308367 [Fusarium avenaceum]|nr:hypothetical protein DER45DRAFT_308367 [Fusarium avenaceum]
MWPLGFREHQLSDHDVEQNETTPWLQHTGWPRLFHNRPLGIIAATAKKPKSAWNEDYLLGQWHDMALRSADSDRQEWRGHRLRRRLHRVGVGTDGLE